MRRVERILWAVLILLLPVSSSPFIAKLTGAQSVASPSILIFLVLVLIWLIPYLFRGEILPKVVIPVLVFVALALIASLLSLFYDIPTFRQIPGVRAMGSDILTLVIGALIYVVASSWAGSEEDLHYLFKLINWSAAALILWGGIQAYFAFSVGEYPAWMEQFQRSVSSSGLLYPRRITGFAFEPSWLAHQLNMLYLPWWLAAAVTGTTVHRWKAGFLTVERLLLVAGLAMLFLTFSRVGWLTVLVLAAYLILWVNIRLIKNAQLRILSSIASPSTARAGRILIPIALTLAMLAVYTGLLFAAGSAMTRLDKRMATLFDTQTLRDEGLVMFANKMLFAERLVTWQTGARIFNDYPILGVGVGNEGFFFPQKISGVGLWLVETSKSIYEFDHLPNIKSLWIRILAEMGIVGFAVVLAWLYILLRFAIRLTRSKDPFTRSMGWMGQFGVLAFVIEGFSLDSYALPYYWTLLGLFTAASVIFYKRVSAEKLPISAPAKSPKG